MGDGPETHERMSGTAEVCANELLRNTIIQKMASWWNVAESFRLPETAAGPGRVGKDPTVLPTKLVGAKCSQGTLPIASTSQESTSLASNSLGRSIA